MRCADCGAYVNEKDAHTCPEPVLVISHCDDINPRVDYDHLGTMACWHQRYTLGDVQPKEDLKEWLEENGPFFVQLPLYLFDHSGIVMSTTPFSCRWDSGQVGVIVAKAEDVRREWGVVNDAIKKKVVECLEAEIRLYDQYLSGDVWGYKYGDDSCYGFFGNELEETGLLDHINAPPEIIRAAWEAR